MNEVENQIKKTKVFAYIGYGILTLAFLVLIVIIYWITESTNVLVIKNGPTSIKPVEIKNEQYVTEHVDFCKTADKIGIVYTTLVSKSTILVLPYYEDSTRKTCREIDIPLPIPGQAVPDRYHYHFKVVYQINPLKTATIEWDTKELKILGEMPKKEISN